MSSRHFPNIDKRTNEYIFKQLLGLAKTYCPQWQSDEKEISNSSDPSVTILQIFSQIAEILVRQVNRIPEKQLLAFYDLIGLEQEPPQAAKVPITFFLRPGNKEVLVPARTKIGSKKEANLLFETIENKVICDYGNVYAYSINTWSDKFTEHGIINSPFNQTQYLFGGGPNEKIGSHGIFISDEAFEGNYSKQIRIKFILTQSADISWIENVSGVISTNPNEKHYTLTSDGPNYHELILVVPSGIIRQSLVKDLSKPWIIFSPKHENPIVQSIENQPSISEIVCDISASKLMPDGLFYNSTILDPKKPMFPFGLTPQVGDALYIASTEVFSKANAKIDIRFKIDKPGIATADLKLNWEFWDSKTNSWRALENVKDLTAQFTNNSLECICNFSCPNLEIIELNGLKSRWIRVRIETGGYGTPGKYDELDIEQIFTHGSNQKNEFLNEIVSLKETLLTQIKKIKDDLKSSFPAMTDDQLNRFFSDASLRQKISILNENNITLSNSTTEFMKDYAESIIEYLKEKGIKTGLTYIPPDFHPPCLNGIQLGFHFEKKKPSCVLTQNNFAFKKIENISLDSILKPYSLFTNDSDYKSEPASYYGFEKIYPGRPIALFFSFQEGNYDEQVPVLQNPFPPISTENSPSRRFMWKYFDGELWFPLPVEDGTGSFTKNGIIEFRIPSDCKESVLFENKKAYWIRVETIKDSSVNLEPMRVKGIFLNTIWAEHAQLNNYEILGSSTGQPFQKFQFASKQILTGQKIEIRENSIPPQDELSMLRKEEGSDCLRIVKNVSGDITEVWVRWHEVVNFSLSKQQSRHYVIDRQNNLLVFSDGIKGMIPPIADNNIIAFQYRNGGGTIGNINPQELTNLKNAIPQVKNVTNFVHAAGGRDFEKIEAVFERAPSTLKNSGKAVTIDDFEELACRASPNILRSRCVVENENIKIMIVPSQENDKPTPDSATIDLVESYIKERCLAIIQNRIQVLGPVYHLIDIHLKVRVTPKTDPFIEETIRLEIGKFFNIATGRDSSGWNFGDSVFISEIALVVERLSGIDVIKAMRLTSNDGTTAEISETTLTQSWIPIKQTELPALGTLTIDISEI